MQNAPLNSYEARWTADGTCLSVRGVAVPLKAHLIWLGPGFPWLHYVAVRSAAERGGFEQVVLHYTDDLSAMPWFRALADVPGVECRRLDEAALLQRAGPDLASKLAKLWPHITRGAQHADVLRTVLLYADGGVYLDIDTVSVASFEALCASESAGFVGEEPICYPQAVKRSRHPWVRGVALGRALVRTLCRWAPGGWKAFRRLQHAYPHAANQAVLGAAPQAPFLRAALETMAATPPEALKDRCVLGPHVIQQLLAAGGSDLPRVLPPAFFYPLPPEISAHWFRERTHGGLAEVLTPETRVVHWYASVRTRHLVDNIDPKWVRAHAKTQLISALTLPFADPPAISTKESG